MVIRITGSDFYRPDDLAIIGTSRITLLLSDLQTRFFKTYGTLDASKFTSTPAPRMDPAMCTSVKALDTAQRE